MKAIIGRKLGMTQLFTEDGELVPVTVIAAGPCPVVAVRSQADDGYDAVQLAYEEVPGKRLIDILQPTPKTVDSLQRLDHLPAGVDIQIQLI